MSTSSNAITGTLIGYGGYGCIDWKTESLINRSLTIDDTFTNTTTQGGYVPADGNLIHITNGNINCQLTRPLQTTYKSPRTTVQVSPLILGIGTASISGSVSFDMTKSNIEYFLDQNKIARNTYFHLFMSDGTKQYAVYHCVWNNITISASAGSLLTCSISFIALNNRNVQIDTRGLTIPTYFDNTLVAYWQAGASNHMQSFNLNFTQQVNPVYLNNSYIMPTYLRCGSIGINATIDSWFGWEDIINDEIRIGNRKVKFNNKTINMRQFSHSGAGDIGKHSYQITSVAVKSPTENIFTISK